MLIAPRVSLGGRAMDARFDLGRNHEALAPQVWVVVIKQGDDTSTNRSAPRLLQAHQKKTVVGSRRVYPYIGRSRDPA